MNYLKLIILLIFLTKLNCWSLDSIKNLTNFTVRHVTIYYMRSFLCIENLNKKKIPTLIEATWPENIIPVTPHPFPSYHEHAKHNAECNKIQTASATSLDYKTRLWIIDNGSDMCPPKLLIYFLFPWPDQILLENFNFIMEKRISSILCDPDYKKNNSARAFISLIDYDFLLIYYLKERKLLKIFFREFNSPNFIQFYPSEIAWARHNHLYLSNYKTGELYRLSLSKLKEIQENFAIAPIRYLGDLLGPPKSMTTDLNGSLYYILPNYNAVIRWNGRRPIVAEQHDVLFQISPQIIQILFGAQGSVWIVTSKSGTYVNSGQDDHCTRILFHYSDPPSIYQFEEFGGGTN